MFPKAPLTKEGNDVTRAQFTALLRAAAFHIPGPVPEAGQSRVSQDKNAPWYNIRFWPLLRISFPKSFP